MSIIRPASGKLRRCPPAAVQLPARIFLILLSRSDSFVPVDLKRRIFRATPRVNQRDRLLLAAQTGREDPAVMVMANVRIREAAFDIDPESARWFLNTAYEHDDWVALFLKSYDTGQVAQRVGPLSWAVSRQCQSWLRTMNSRRFNVYVSVNAITA